MGLIDSLERLLIPSKRQRSERIDLREVICKPKKKNLVQTFRTPAAGCEYTNMDGSERQLALEKLKVGERVRIMWDAGKDGNKKTLYLVRRRHTQGFSMADCFGRLNDKVAADVIRWLTQDKIATAAHVAKIVGGTRKRPKLGCILELSTYRTAERDRPR